MRTPLLLLALIALLTNISYAGNKDAPADPISLKKTAASLTEEADMIETTLGTGASADAKKFISWTREESAALTKAAEALEKNQKRLAERLASDAKEFCEKRGKLASKIHEETKKAGKKPEAVKPDRAAEMQKKWQELEKRQQELDEEKKKLLSETADQMGR